MGLMSGPSTFQEHRSGRLRSPSSAESLSRSTIEEKAISVKFGSRTNPTERVLLACFSDVLPRKLRLSIGLSPGFRARVAGFGFRAMDREPRTFAGSVDL